MKKFRSLMAVTIATTMLIAPLSGCSKKKDTAVEDAEATVTSYMDNLIADKLNKNSKLVKGDDMVPEIDISLDQSIVLEALLSTATYEITESEVSSDSGKGEVTIELTTVDIEEVMKMAPVDAEEAANLIDGLSDKDSYLITDELTIPVRLVDEDWLITEAGTEDIADYLVSLVEDCAFNSVDSEEAFEITERYYDNLRQGLFEDAIDLLLYPEDAGYEDLSDLEFLVASTFFSYMGYGLSYAEEDSDSVTIIADISGPDPAMLFNTLYNDRELMVSIIADELYLGLTGAEPDSDVLSDANYDKVELLLSAACAANSDWLSFTQEVVVVRDDDGELKLIVSTPDDAFALEPGMATSLSTEYTAAAITLLYEDGRLDYNTASSFYYSYMGEYPDWYLQPGQFPGGLDDDGRAPDEILMDTTEQCVLFEDETAPSAPSVSNEPYVFTNDADMVSDVIYLDLQGNEVPDYCGGMDGFMLDIKMKDYVLAGDVYLYDVYCNGEYMGTSWTTAMGDYVAPTELYIAYADEDGLSTGSYVVVLYQVGGTRNNVLTTISFIVFESQGG